jgi:nitrile hydratase subunit beta
MKLQHNLGGIENLGSFPFEKRVFVEEWEKRIFGIHVAMMGLSSHLDTALPKYPIEKVPTAFKDEWTWADLRKGAEAMHPFDYFKYRYYEKWLGGISGFFVQKGYVDGKALEAKTAALLAGNGGPRPVRPSAAIDEQVMRYLREGDSGKRPGPAPRWTVGDTVKVRDVHPTEHTRLPGYLRNKLGVVDVVYEGAFAYFCSTGPDGIGSPMPVYCVKFDPEDIWGEMAEENSAIYADLFEAYLLPAA